MKYKFICPACKSDRVKCDAYAAWDEDTQQWEVSCVFANGWCDECEGPIGHLDEIEIEKEES